MVKEADLSKGILLEKLKELRKELKGKEEEIRELKRDIKKSDEDLRKVSEAYIEGRGHLKAYEKLFGLTIEEVFKRIREL